MPALVVSLIDPWVGELIWGIDVKDCAGSFIVDTNLIFGWQFALEYMLRWRQYLGYQH